MGLPILLFVVFIPSFPGRTVPQAPTANEARPVHLTCGILWDIDVDVSRCLWVVMHIYTFIFYMNIIEYIYINYCWNDRENHGMMIIGLLVKEDLNHQQPLRRAYWPANIRGAHFRVHHHPGKRDPRWFSQLATTDPKLLDRMGASWWTCWNPSFHMVNSFSNLSWNQFPTSSSTLMAEPVEPWWDKATGGWWMANLVDTITWLGEFRCVMMYVFHVISIHYLHLRKVTVIWRYTSMFHISI